MNEVKSITIAATLTCGSAVKSGKEAEAQNADFVRVWDARGEGEMKSLKRQDAKVAKGAPRGEWRVPSEGEDFGTTERLRTTEGTDDLDFFSSFSGSQCFSG
jgi:hypothetical protein